MSGLLPFRIAELGILSLRTTLWGTLTYSRPIYSHFLSIKILRVMLFQANACRSFLLMQWAFKAVGYEPTTILTPQYVKGNHSL